MEIPPVIKGERSCRNCDCFKSTSSCWKRNDGCGEGMPNFIAKALIGIMEACEPCGVEYDEKDKTCIACIPTT